MSRYTGLWRIGALQERQYPISNIQFPEARMKNASIQDIDDYTDALDNTVGIAALSM
jgi:hypothetical protein